MPHSVSPEAMAEVDSALPDAPPPPQSDQDSGPSAKDEAGGEMELSGEEEANLPKMKKPEVNLEDLFQTDDEDEEFPSSAPSGVVTGEAEGSSSPVADRPAEPSTNYADPEIMLAFYQRLFPFRPLFQWLNHSMKPSNNFAHREFAFTLQNDAYLRYQSFPTADLLRKEVIRLNPSRFEIGPVYSTNPRDRKTLRKASTFRPISKELVFDIDLTDYDEIRTCCDKANICNKCWQFITMSIKVVDAALREDFGFRHIMWVYSGRRGAHAWISDKKAREMDDSRRRAVAGYLEVIKGGSQSGKKVNVKRPLHPHLVRSLDLLKEHFKTDILLSQDPWSAPSKTEHLLSLIPDRALADALRKKWASAPGGRSSANKWADIDALAKAGVSRALDGKALLEAKRDVVLEYTYPRLDAEVSKKLNHLLKSPFVVHPKTGRVCVPIDLADLEAFDPLTVPTVTQLLAEIDAWEGEKGKSEGEGEVKAEGEANGEGKGGKKPPVQLQDYEKTSLKPYVEFFRAHVAALLRDERGIKREREEGDAMEF